MSAAADARWLAGVAWGVLWRVLLGAAVVIVVLLGMGL